jgi:hypothetical protein
MDTKTQVKAKPSTLQQSADKPLREGALRRKCACGDASGIDGTCPACRRKRVSGHRNWAIQTKLAINPPDDYNEQAAEQMAEQIMRLPTGSEQRTGFAVQPATQRQAASTTTAGLAPPIVQETLQTAGQPLAPAVRAWLEPRFGHDFSQVRIHTDQRAATSAQAIQARAYTVHEDIVFAPGQFAPWTSTGRRLLSHELAHVVQQAQGTPSVMRVPEEDGISETPPRYAYSTNCGWIDWTHASSDLPAILMQRIRDASDQMRESGSSTPQPVMAPPMTSTGLGLTFSSVAAIFRIKRPLNTSEILSVALRVFMLQSLGFESLQGWTDWLKSSSFSEEDLPSNIIAFYRNATGISRSGVETVCGVWSPADSLREFQSYRFQKSAMFRPLTLPSGGSWPAQLSSITPAAPGGPLMDFPEGRFETPGSTFQRDLTGYQVITDPALHIEDLSGSDPINIAGTEAGPAHGPHFEVRPLPSAPGLRARWVIQDASDRRYRMLGNNGEEVFHFGTEFNAFINAPTRALLRDNGITSAKILCRLMVGAEGEDATMQRLLELPVRFTW